MLTDLLRIELIVVAILTLAIVSYTVMKKKMQLKYSFIWMAISLLLIVMSVFPKLVFAISAWLGVETPSNLIFLLSIIALSGICFSFSMIVSKQDNSIRRMVQMISIANFESEEKDLSKQKTHNK